MKKMSTLWEVAVLILFFSFNSAIASEHIVLVNGIDSAQTAQCGFKYCPESGYLSDDLESIIDRQMEEGGKNAEIHEFRWSRDMVTHGEHLKSKFQDWFYEYVCNEGDTCNISFIAHSWGTIIATDFIASIPDDTNVKIRTVVTFGSPVTGAQIAFWKDAFWQQAIEKVMNDNNDIENEKAEWINIVNKNDPIAWDYLDNGWLWDSEIPGVKNVQPDGSKSTKGRLNETFPVSNSEFDYHYLGTSFVRLYETRGAEALNVIINSWNGDSGPNLDAHKVSNYEPERLVRYVTERLPVEANFPETAIKSKTSDSPYADEENAFKDSASQTLTGQCTWYVYGRVMELVDKGYFDESVGQKMRDTFWGKYGRDAKNWPDLLGGVWTCTNTNPLPMEKRKKGMIAVWKNGSHGHVGFVEEISDDLTQYRLSDFNRFGQQKYRDSMYHFEGSDDAMGGSYPCFYELASDYENNNGTSTAYPFVDVDPDEWFAEPVFELYKRGIVHGHDGSRYYKPADDMTRAEFIKIVVLAHEKAAGREFTSETCNAPYNDVYSSHWACKYITAAYNKGWIVYDSAHRYFHPDEPVNRAEIAKILVKAHGSAEVFASQAKIFVEYIPGWAFADVTDENDWFYDYVYICKALGVFGGYPQGTLCDGSRTSSVNTYFCPAKNINRAEAAKVVYKTFFTE